VDVEQCRTSARVEPDNKSAINSEQQKGSNPVTPFDAMMVKEQQMVSRITGTRDICHRVATHITANFRHSLSAVPDAILGRPAAAMNFDLGRASVAIILYVDTDQLYMSALKLLLEGNGFKVLLARSREHMREVLLTNMVDVALVDNDFARDYPQLLREVRAVSPLSRTVLLGMRDAEEPVEPADDYCARLQGPDRLLSVLNAAVARRPLQNAHRA
jgi:hypothetical protein